MSNTINVQCVINSNVHGTEVYALSTANVAYDLSTQANIDNFRSFVITHKGQTNYDGIVKLISNVTGESVHQGEGDEEFKGTLSHAFDDLNTATDAPIVVRSNYTNYVFSAIQDGLNRSIWTMDVVRTDTTYYMLYSPSVGPGAPDGAKPYMGITTTEDPQSYFTTESEIDRYLGENDPVIMANVILSSALSPGIERGGVSLTYPDSEIRKEFMLIREADGITGFNIKNRSDGNNHGMNVEIRKFTGEIPEFDAALLNGNAISNTTPWRLQPNADAFVSKFTLIGSVQDVAGVSFNFKEGIVRETNSENNT